MDLKEAAEKHSGQAQGLGQGPGWPPPASGPSSLLSVEGFSLQRWSHRGRLSEGLGGWVSPGVRGVFPVMSFPALAACKQRPGVRETRKGDGLCLPPNPRGCKSESLAASPLGLLRGNPQAAAPVWVVLVPWHWASSERHGRTLGPSARVQGQTVFPQHQHRGSRRPRPAPRGQSAHPEMTFQPGLKVSGVGRYRLRCWACRCCCCSFSHQMDCAYKRA